MNILLTIDDNYIDIAENMLYSLRQYNRNLIIHVVYDSLSKESLEKLKTFIEENKIGKFKSYYFDTSVLNIKNIRSTYITKTCYLRIFAPYVIPNIDRFLYMDPDIICRGSIRRLYNMNLGDKIIGAAKNMFRSVYEHLRKRKRAELKLPETFPYVNSGVLVVDTKKYKKYIKKEDLIEELRRIQESLEYQDQDYINMKFHDVIKIFSNKYNYQINAIDWCDINMNQVLIHYAEGKKPWNKNYHDIFRAMPYYNVLYDRGMDYEVKNLLFAHSTNNVYGSYGALKYDDNDIKLIKFTDKKDNYKLMHKWCSNEFIYEWFEQRKLSYDEIVNKYKKKLSDKK